MELFYLEELSRQKRANKQLEWRLSLLREELNNNHSSFVKGRDRRETTASWMEE